MDRCFKLGDQILNFFEYSIMDSFQLICISSTFVNFESTDSPETAW